MNFTPGAILGAITLSCAALACSSGPAEPQRPATGALNVRVTDELEAPVANVAVTVTHGQQSNTANTDQSGRAAFQDVAVGTAMVTIAVPAQYRSTETSRQITVTSGPNVVTTTFSMTLRAAAISLSVVDSTGGYVPDVQFEVGNGSAETIRGSTDVRGRAVVTRVPAGSWSVRIADNLLPGFTGATPVTLNEGVTNQVLITTPPLTRGSWSEKVNLPGSRASLAAVATATKIIVLGGGGTTNLDAFDGTSWVKESDIPQALNAAAAALIDNEIIIAGGFIGLSNQPTDRVNIYNLTSKTWRQGSAMPTPRGGIQAAVLNGKIHVVGGGNQSSTLDAHEVYDPGTNTWTSLAPLPSSRGNPALAVFNGKLYAIGGASGGNNFANVDIFDPATGAWTAGPPLPRARVAARAVVYRGALYVLGGEATFTASLDDVWRLNTQTGTWEAMTRMPNGRSYAGAVVLGDAIYVVGGSSSRATTHEDPGTNTVQRFVLR